MTDRDTIKAFSFFTFFFCAFVTAVHVSEKNYGFATMMAFMTLLNLGNLIAPD